VSSTSRVDAIERIRNASFTLARRGYDRNEVDGYLAKLADWLEGGGSDMRAATVREELERVGRRTAKILKAAEEAAEGIRADIESEARELTEDARIEAEAARRSAHDHAKRTREEAEGRARELRDDADDYVERVRREADEYASKLRRDAEAEADENLRAAEAEAIRMVEEGAKRRREMERVIADLQARREAVVKGLEKLSSQLAGTATEAKERAPAGAADPERTARAPAPSRP